MTIDDISNNTLSYGTNCKDKNHKLIPVRLEQLVEYITNGPQGLIEQTQILRKIRKYSKDRYRHMKTKLPFFSCSIFQPALRRKENFLYAQGCIMDLDWKKKLDETTYKKIATDPRVALAYVSPSGAGAKLVFLFDRWIENGTDYSLIYKRYIHQFAYSYKLMDVTDFRNSDVSRISFICHDPKAIYNPDAIRISPDVFITENPDQPQTQKEDIAPDVYKSILVKLDTRPTIRKNPITVSAEITAIMDIITEALGAFDIKIQKTEGIQSGIKLKIILNKDFGEVNIYHGRRGYSVTSSPKRGTRYELNEVARHIIESVLPIRYKTLNT